ncbi:hemolysin family protein [Aerococcus kribbianus]|uniref:Hemolysin family protein n=1 Tax=Aerococcus kribbianus TaxID=2999064 RepID=A0A9X3FQS6_9LACT|nr:MULTISPECIES: hemolysin family protein [unclassified Aerococcus]MCZ0717872.1 hemolysin family protein [Aerococcus sp. YH-aer221]MCZ0726159.1 hemolysin family protein [Aerococcus sp. YH-aer222]
MEDPGAANLSGQIILIIILTAINAYLAGAELAFVSVNQSRLKEEAEEGNKRARQVLKLLENSDDFLSTIQVGITFAGFFSSASASTTFVSYLAPLLSGIPAGATIATAIVTLILSYFTLVFGELFPKQVAMQMPEKYAKFVAPSINFLQIIFKPFVWLLSASTSLLKRITPIEFTNKDQHLTRNEMQAIIASGRNDGVIDLDEFRMMQGVLSLDTKLAKEVMTPRTDTFMVDIEDDQAEALQEVLASQYSRIPVYEDDKDNIIGIMHAKDILRAAKKVGFEGIQIEEIAKPAYFAPETIFIDDLLLDFKRNHQHMAVLKDEYNGVAGIVTLEDLLEEIVGDIEDEYDEISHLYKKINDTTYIINGVLPVDKFNILFKEDVDTEESDTIAGYMIERLGYFPEDRAEEIIRVGKYELTTTAVENGRIRGIQVKEKYPEEDNDDLVD